MALNRPVHAPEAEDGTTAPAVAAPVALGAAVQGGLAQKPPPPGILAFRKLRGKS